MRGQGGEDRAAEFLRAQGLKVLLRNWRCKAGELDLICQDGKTLVFVEVRQRSSGTFGGAAASITAAKRAKLWAAAQIYLQGVRPTPPCRFDAVCIEGERIDWWKNCIEG
ncbi:putative endonuclease [Andreprevotia lacus DSM 23236]|jgi:putative endonuclease|uniref:UPF0102 protein SAMN02745857_00176 n=1 Tax=Andreprevotia lacus DSM 23236 TaxID=1121001 RepID=A0A1W1WXL3_9NEIS|nr:YraN family protein [Andreprevotia lacus]SMC16395.1 putative endonuclease [Andreprevotia lacus DSM 23236]